MQTLTINNEILAFRTLDAATRMACAPFAVNQSALNHTRQAHRGGFVPMIIFTGLLASFPLQAIFDSTKTPPERLNCQPKLS